MVKIIIIEMESEKIIDEINKAIIDTTGGREHITDIERGIYTIKETSRCERPKTVVWTFPHR